MSEMGRPGAAAYISSKAAVKQFAKVLVSELLFCVGTKEMMQPCLTNLHVISLVPQVLASELGPKGITVNTIQPGAMDTIGQRRSAMLRLCWGSSSMRYFSCSCSFITRWWSHTCPAFHSW